MGDAATPEGGLVPRCREAIVDEGKLADYLLDEAHEHGGHKATVLRSALGYENRPEHARMLREQLLRGVSRTPYEGEPAPAFGGVGRKYRVRMEIDGPNGRRAVFSTGWQIDRQGERPRFLSGQVKGRSWLPDRPGVPETGRG